MLGQGNSIRTLHLFLRLQEEGMSGSSARSIRLEGLRPRDMTLLLLLLPAGTEEACGGHLLRGDHH